MVTIQQALAFANKERQASAARRVALWVLIVAVVALAALSAHNTRVEAQLAYCRGYEAAFMSSGDIFLSWSDVPGCDGLH